MPLETFIPAITGHNCTPAERCLLALPVRMGGLGITNPCHITASEYEASTAKPLVKKIVAQTHELPDNHAIGHCTSETVERRMLALKTT